jgi:hypothetical protein
MLALSRPKIPVTVSIIVIFHTPRGPRDGMAVAQSKESASEQTFGPVIDDSMQQARPWSLIGRADDIAAKYVESRRWLPDRNIMPLMLHHESLMTEPGRLRPAKGRSVFRFAGLAGGVQQRSRFLAAPARQDSVAAESDQREIFGKQ